MRLLAFAGIAFLFVGPSVTTVAAATDLSLWYSAPAAHWTDALPVGNGRLGAMVFGGVDHERLQLNEITVWSGGVAAHADRVDAYKGLPEIRGALRDGNYAAAGKLCQKFFTPTAPYDPSYQTLGDLALDFDPLPTTPTQYRRSLDLSRAVAGVQYQVGADSYTRETFSSAADGVIAVHLGCTRKGGLSLHVSLSRVANATTRAAGSDGLLMSGATDHPADVPGLAFEAQLRVLRTGGTVSADPTGLRISGADDVLLLLAAGTNYVPDYAKQYAGEDPHAAVTARLAAAAAKPYATLTQAHVADYRKLFDRVAFSLPPGSDASLPTDERLKRFGDGKADPSLATLFYQFGRYLLISSSRPDNPLPSNSQGIWGDGLNLPWKCDYKSNINFQMNYWPAESANLSECHEPMLRLVRSLVTPGTKTALAYFNAPGWVCFYTTNAWGWTSPGAGLPWGIFYGASAWECRHFWEHYAYTGDRAALAESYPVMRGACEFYLSVLVPDADGQLVLSPSSSPENQFRTDAGQRGTVCQGSAVDREVVWDLFTNTIRAERALNVTDGLSAKLTGALAKIRPPQVGKGGQLMELPGDWDHNAPEVHHRHISHLYALFPGDQITALGTPELAAAVKQSLNDRGDVGTGWSKAWKINLWARLRDGDHAFGLLAEQLHLATSNRTNYTDGGGSYANLFDAHPPFQIDGNFGGVSGIDEMLLQSHEMVPGHDDRHVIDLLPALPAAWPNGTISGLRARGGVDVSLNWSKGKLTSATLRSVAGGVVQVRSETRLIDLTLPAGTSVTLDADLKGK